MKEIIIDDKYTLLHHWRFTLPTSPEYLEIAPDGRHLAWLHYAYTATKNVDEESVYTSQIDGSRIQEIGHIQIPSEAEHYMAATEAPRYLKWLPDSKRLSFLYHDTLYVVSIDEKK